VREWLRYFRRKAKINFELFCSNPCETPILRDVDIKSRVTMKKFADCLEKDIGVGRFANSSSEEDLESDI